MENLQMEPNSQKSVNRSVQSLLLSASGVFILLLRLYEMDFQCEYIPTVYLHLGHLADPKHYTLYNTYTALYRWCYGAFGLCALHLQHLTRGHAWM